MSSAGRRRSCIGALGSDSLSSRVQSDSTAPDHGPERRACSRRGTIPFCPRVALWRGRSERRGASAGVVHRTGPPAAASDQLRRVRTKIFTNGRLTRIVAL